MNNYYSNTIKIDGNLYYLLNDGIQYDFENLRLAFLCKDKTFDEIEQMLSDLPETIYIYDSTGIEVTGSFTGYSILNALTKKNAQQLHEDPDYFIVDVTFSKPDLQMQIDETKDDIEVINGAIEELAEIIGG